MTENAANADQIEFWNEVQGDKWVRLMDQIDAMLSPFGEAAMRALAPQPGERLLDLGCGFGATCMALAEAVGSEGSVVGADISRPMIAEARARVPANVEIREADVQVHEFEGASFDGAFSRFGVMFYSDPMAAFANVHKAVRPGGRLAFAAWRPREENPWITELVAVARKHVELPPKPGPDEPGQFSFADEARVRRILEDSGWADVTFERFAPELAIGGSVAEAVAFLMQMGPAAGPLAESDEATRAEVAKEAQAVYVRHADGPDSPPVLKFSACIVSARRPD